MNEDLDIKVVQKFVESNPDIPVVRAMQAEFLSALADLESVRNISEGGDVALQALGKKYAFERLEELFNRLGFCTKRPSSPKQPSFR